MVLNHSKKLWHHQVQTKMTRDSNWVIIKLVAKENRVNIFHIKWKKNLSIFCYFHINCSTICINYQSNRILFKKERPSFFIYWVSQISEIYFRQFKRGNQKFYMTCNFFHHNRFFNYFFVNCDWHLKNALWYRNLL